MIAVSDRYSLKTLSKSRPVDKFIRDARPNSTPLVIS